MNLRYEERKAEGTLLFKSNHIMDNLPKGIIPIVGKNIWNFDNVYMGVYGIGKNGKLYKLYSQLTLNSYYQKRYRWVEYINNSSSLILIPTTTPIADSLEDFLKSDITQGTIYHLFRTNSKKALATMLYLLYVKKLKYNPRPKESK